MGFFGKSDAQKKAQQLAKDKAALKSRKSGPWFQKPAPRGMPDETSRNLEAIRRKYEK